MIFSIWFEMMESRMTSLLFCCDSGTVAQQRQLCWHFLVLHRWDYLVQNELSRLDAFRESHIKIIGFWNGYFSSLKVYFSYIFWIELNFELNLNHRTTVCSFPFCIKLYFKGLKSSILVPLFCLLFYSKPSYKKRPFSKTVIF